MKSLIKSKIIDIPDWPKKGVVFRDITPLLEDKELFSRTIDYIASPYLGRKIDKVVGIDARGFIFASALAYKLNCGLAIVRKKGKLPRETISNNYSLEYNSSVVEMHKDSIKPGERVLIVDDVLATGGTMKAVADLVKQLGGEIVSIDFLIELSYLKGREKIKEHNVNSVLDYQAENTKKIAIIGGSGFYNFFNKETKEIEIETEFGRPSDKITVANLFGKEVYFLPRHGKSHSLPPHKIPYRANIKALKDLGVDIIIAPTAVGSLKEEVRPGDFVIADQFVNKTSKREDTFFEGPEVRHIEGAFPFCPSLRKIAIEQGKRLGLNIKEKGIAVVIEGPRFSTLAESLWFSKMGWDLVNMTLYPEVILASELGICYLNISLVTDYDAGLKQGVGPVSIEEVLRNFKENTEKLKDFIKAIIENIPEKLECNCKEKAEKAKI